MASCEQLVRFPKEKSLRDNTKNKQEKTYAAPLVNV